jgi:hypothetical protein
MAARYPGPPTPSTEEGGRTDEVGAAAFRSGTQRSGHSAAAPRTLTGMADFTEAQAAVVRIERAEPGRWDLSVISDSGVTMGHGVYLFEPDRDDAQDEIAGAAEFVRDYGFRFEADAVVADGPDAFWAPLLPLD